MDTSTKLIIGLGNPGKEYEGTRHNIGFAVVDSFAKQHGIAVTRKDNQALIGDGRVGDSRVFLMKPQTFMNLSGQSAAAFLRMKPLEMAEMMVVTDDISLPLGRLRLRAEGSAGGHNGLKSLIAHLHGQAFPRLRFGVGAPRDPSVQIDFVLGRFGRSEAAEVEEGVERAVAALERWLTDGIQPAMNQFNR